jgi:glucose/arabinose dehydrogenase
MLLPSMEPPIISPKSKSPWYKNKLFITMFMVLGMAIIGTLVYILLFRNHSDKTSNVLETPGGVESQPLHEPELKNEEIVGGYSNIWDLVFIDDKTIVFDERGGKLHGAKIDSKEKWEIGIVPNVRAEGEGGLLGLAYDVEFSTNRYMYACYNAQGARPSVRVTRFKLSDDAKSVSGFTDIIPDIQSQAGRHSGCRLLMDINKVLWVATGDSAIGSAPQDPKSLGGKILRVDRDGKAVSGNLSAPFDSRIYNYGHRNIQGLVLLKRALPNGAIGLTSEHGPGKDDEVNWLMPGNFGWNPNGARGAYDESVAMTDKVKYPDAIEAVWSSGEPTIAPSSITFLTHSRWSLWQGWAAMAVLKGEHVRLLGITGEGLIGEKEILKDDFGRIRTVIEGPLGEMYLTTDNGSGNDKIIKISAQ